MPGIAKIIYGDFLLKFKIMQALFFFSAFFAEIAGTIAGFGSSTIFLPLALFFVDFKTALLLVALTHIFGNLGKITFFKHGIDKRLIIVFGLPSILLSLLGASLVGYINQDILKMILGIFLAVFSLGSLLAPDFKFAPVTRNAIVGGAISGFMAGLVGTGGALRSAFLTAFNLEKEKYIATAAVIAIAVDVTRVPVYFFGNFMSKEYYYFVPALFAIAVLGSFIGKKMVDKIPQDKFRKLVLLAIFLISLKLIWDYFS